MGVPSARSVWLDTTGEPWVGHFTGLGRVEVYADGRVTAFPEAGTEDDEAVLSLALTHGWGEPLALVRRGFSLIAGCALVPHGSHPGAWLLLGDCRDCAVVLIELSRRGWSVLADRCVPTRMHDDDLMAYPRITPVVASRRQADRAGLTQNAVRADTDAVTLAVQRAATPAKVNGFVLLGRRRPHEQACSWLVGKDRFAAAASLRIGGVGLLGPGHSAGSPLGRPTQALTEDLRMAALPFARLRFDEATITRDTTALVDLLTSHSAASEA